MGIYTWEVKKYFENHSVQNINIIIFRVGVVYGLLPVSDKYIFYTFPSKPYGFRKEAIHVLKAKGFLL